jgi:hypothetical protein
VRIRRKSKERTRENGESSDTHCNLPNRKFYDLLQALSEECIPAICEYQQEILRLIATPTCRRAIPRGVDPEVGGGSDSGPERLLKSRFTQFHRQVNRKRFKDL